jgi:hypothetical protein
MGPSPFVINGFFFRFVSLASAANGLQRTIKRTATTPHCEANNSRITALVRASGPA